MITYRLMLYANVPEASGVDVTYLSSPVVTLGRYDGHFRDSHAPRWTRLRMGMTVELRQPSSAIADVFAELAFWPENVEHVVCHLPCLFKHFTPSRSYMQLGLSTSMLEWSSVISVSSPLL